MIHQETITTPANTYLVNEQKSIYSISNGLIYDIEIQFPPGSLGLLRVRIMDGGHQLWPSRNGEHFRGNDVIIKFEDLYLKDTQPYSFDVLTYNTDDTYDHDVIIRLGQVSKDVYLARFLPHLGYAEFSKMLEDLAKKQQEEVLKANRVIINNPLSWINKQQEK